MKRVYVNSDVNRVLNFQINFHIDFKIPIFYLTIFLSLKFTDVNNQMFSRGLLLKGENLSATKKMTNIFF